MDANFSSLAVSVSDGKLLCCGFEPTAGLARFQHAGRRFGGSGLAGASD